MAIKLSSIFSGVLWYPKKVLFSEVVGQLIIGNCLSGFRGIRKKDLFFETVAQ